MWPKLHLLVFAAVLFAFLGVSAEPDSVDKGDLVEEGNRANCAQAWKSCDHRPCCVVNGWHRVCRCSLIGSNCECVTSIREDLYNLFG